MAVKIFAGLENLQIVTVSLLYKKEKVRFLFRLLT